MATIPISGDAAPVTLAPFDPADWLARFEAVGGCWIVTSFGKASVGWCLDGYTHEQNLEARRIFAALESDPAKRAAVRAIIFAKAGQVDHG